MTDVRTLLRHLIADLEGAEYDGMTVVPISDVLPVLRAIRDLYACETADV